MKKKYTLLISILTLVLFLTGCSLFTSTKEIEEVRRTFFPMDTILEFVIQTDDVELANEAIDSAYAEIERLEKMLSATIETSEVSKINKNAGIAPVKVSQETFELLELGIEYAELTHGKFDITIAPLLKVYDWREGERTEALPDPKEVEAAMELVNYKDLELDEDNMTAFLTRPKMQIDLGGIGKGYIVDKAVEVLKGYELEYGYVNGGGDIRFLGPKSDLSPWRIGVTNPRGSGNVGVVNISDNAIVTSGDYERFFITDEGLRIHHIIDPHTGISSNYVQSVTTVAENATVADILSTALFMFPAEQALQLAEELNVGAVIITVDGDIVMTSDMEEMTTLLD